MGQLHIGRVAAKRRDGVAGPFHQGGVVGEAVLQGCGRGLVRFEQRPEAEGLGCLDADELVPRRGLGDVAMGIRALDRVGDRQGGDSCEVAGAESVDRRADLGAGHEGPGGVMDEHDTVEAGAGQGEQSAPHGGLAGLAAQRGSGEAGAVEAGDGTRVARLVAFADDDRDAFDRRIRQERHQRMGEDGAAIDEAVLLRLAIARPQAAACRDQQGSNGRERIGRVRHEEGPG